MHGAVREPGEAAWGVHEWLICIRALLGQKGGAREQENPLRKNTFVHGRPNARSACAHYSGTPVRARVFPGAQGLPANRAHPSIPSLRPYQQDCLDALSGAVAAGRSSLGVMPTGSGKSLVIAGLMARLVEAGRRSLMLTHVRELIEQDAAAFERFAPGMDNGVFCRGLGRFELNSPVIFAQTQSLHARKHLLTEPFDAGSLDRRMALPVSPRLCGRKGACRMADARRQPGSHEHQRGGATGASGAPPLASSDDQRDDRFSGPDPCLGVTAGRWRRHGHKENCP
ncbi:MAG: DEAD/DEAH box helicase [Rhodoplanes sp.]